ncbi:hypothetical protein AA21291_0887 [Swaminathania salitolerans LMG 21291]|uniref:Uncharacterized protein n=1 Tax=Swaminathania salitolerans TaxID=182838 RepID=A0A511BQC2_9PROT|nr:hypothetical protein AA21291_0887 [Swaminathania salitolerans LMG 21291]GEL02547.1 hypothetical protein SSA02_17100 [Swaminathania salitolerans]
MPRRVFPGFRRGAGCRLSGACRLQHVPGEALGAFMTVLDGQTLADLLAPPGLEAMAARIG